jgi:hypothetical protein
MFMGGGEGPFGSIFMGGMFTILKVRENLASYDEDPGWYEHPPGTLASAVGARQTLTPPAGRPARPAALAALSPGVPLQAVKAGSCASMSPRSR